MKQLLILASALFYFLAPSGYGVFNTRSSDKALGLVSTSVQGKLDNTRGYTPDNNPVTRDEDPNNYPLERPRTYKNIDHDEVQSPTQYNAIPAGACAICNDGSYSFSKHRRGTCSRHGGVSEWLNRP